MCFLELLPLFSSISWVNGPIRDLNHKQAMARRPVSQKSLEKLQYFFVCCDALYMEPHFSVSVKSQCGVFTPNFGLTVSRKRGIFIIGFCEAELLIPWGRKHPNNQLYIHMKRFISNCEKLLYSGRALPCKIVISLYNLWRPFTWKCARVVPQQF